MQWINWPNFQEIVNEPAMCSPDDDDETATNGPNEIEDFTYTDNKICSQI